MKKEKTEFHYWLKYLLTNKKNIIVFLVHLALFYFLIKLTTFGHYLYSWPTTKLIFSNKLVLFIISRLRTYFSNKNGTLSIWKVALYILGNFTVIAKGFIFLFRMNKRRFDLTFSSILEQTIQSIAMFFACFSLLWILFMVLVLSNLFVFFNRIDPSFPAIIITTIISLVAFVITVIRNIKNLSDNSRSNILSIIYALIIIYMIVKYPVENISFTWSAIYSFCLSILSISLMYTLEIGQGNVSIYCFRNSMNGILFIHYRLDEDRIVCSPDAKLTDTSKKVIYNISDLYDKTIIKDISNYNKSWNDTVSVIKSIRQKRHKTRIHTAIMNGGFKKRIQPLSIIVQLHNKNHDLRSEKAQLQKDNKILKDELWKCTVEI